MMTSYIVDGFADVGTMVGSAYLGEKNSHKMRDLSTRLVVLGLSVGVMACLILTSFRGFLIGLFLEEEAAVQALMEVLVAMVMGDGTTEPRQRVGSRI